MGRPRKEVSAPVEITPEIVAPVVETQVVAPVVEAPVVKAKGIVITASFKTRSMEGDRVTHKYKGVGKSLAEAIESVVGDDEDLTDEFEKPFPRGINILTNCTVRTDGYEFSRALAPHVAKDIFENKNVALAARLLGL